MNPFEVFKHVSGIFAGINLNLLLIKASPSHYVCAVGPLCIFYQPLPVQERREMRGDGKA